MESFYFVYYLALNEVLVMLRWLVDEAKVDVHFDLLKATSGYHTNQHQDIKITLISAENSTLQKQMGDKKQVGIL